MPDGKLGMFVNVFWGVFCFLFEKSVLIFVFKRVLYFGLFLNFYFFIFFIFV
jgi:hypothetical protein